MNGGRTTNDEPRIKAASGESTPTPLAPEASGEAPQSLARSPQVPDIYLGLGSNVGDRLAALQSALDGLVASGVDVEAVSPVYETEAHVRPGAAPQRDHLNAACRVRSPLAPEALLDVIHRVEREAGRDHAAPPWSPRPLDVDVLLWGDRVIATDALSVPHPRLRQRRFVLAPLAAIACDLVVPGTGATACELLAVTPDHSRVERFPRSLTVPKAPRRERA